MNQNSKVSPEGSDWTRLLTDPELVSHLPQLLQTYREVPPEQREAALLQVMKQIKEGAAKQRLDNGGNADRENKAGADALSEGAARPSDDLDALDGKSGVGEGVECDSAESENAECEGIDENQGALNVENAAANEHQTADENSPVEEPGNEAEVHREELTLTPKTAGEVVTPEAEFHRPEPVTEAPPFETDPLSDLSSDDRRRFHRIKCYVAVEIHIEGVEAPVWGNLANVSRGGCLVETASAVPPGKALEIGLWVASGKIWVKGVILTGVAQRTASFGVRVKFSQAELSEKQHLRDFLKLIEGTARKSHSGNAYLAQLKT
jgi:hypothetical protein